MEEIQVHEKLHRFLVVFELSVAQRQSKQAQKTRKDIGFVKRTETQSTSCSVVCISAPL